VAIGADLAPGTLLSAYRCGLFPMAVDGPGSRGRSEMAWWSPQQRGVLPLSALRVSRSMRQSARHFEVRVDTVFSEVVRSCADPSRSGGWIDDWAHSVESWRDGELAGGLYGVAIGGLFAGESMFTRARDASKVALMGLVDLLDDEYAGKRLLDTQWQTPHLETLGVEQVPRQEYLERLDEALQLPLPAAWN